MRREKESGSKYSQTLYSSEWNGSGEEIPTATVMIAMKITTGMP